MTKITIHENKGLDRQHRENVEYFRAKNEKSTNLTVTKDNAEQENINPDSGYCRGKAGHVGKAVR